MKRSSDIQLKNRGYITNEQSINYSGFSEQELIELLNSKEACERTIAARLLASLNNNEQIIILLCEKLAKENKLYTKIEICNSLSSMGIKAAEVMVNYLGTIGENQYKTLPEEEFKKKSYPLPRDIIARTLGNMGKEILPVLVEVLSNNNIISIREVVDAIGWICFYDYSDYPLKYLIDCFNEKGKDEIIRWKLVRAFCSFSNEKVIDILSYTINSDAIDRIRNEAERSLNIIINRSQGIIMG